MDALDPDALRTLVEDLVPFNRFLGVRLASVDRAAGRLGTSLELRPEFVGNALRDMPHGGVVSALIDATAGAAAALSLDDLSLADRVATIDMRVDYLRAARGASLHADAEVMRTGHRVVVVRTVVHDDDGELVALGSNAFHVAR
jgi:uncharacterized protein (TIGR00369 family)